MTEDGEAPADDGRDAAEAEEKAAEAEEKVAEPKEAGAPPLAAIVPKPRSETVLAALRDDGSYDDARRIREHDDGTIAIPVTGPIAPGRREQLGIVEIARQEDPESRTTGLADLLAERGWSEAELETAPSSWAVVGTVVLVDVPEDCHDETAVGEALLELHRGADTVLAREGIDGQTREPSRRVLAGIGDTETVHAEHGVRYALDLAEVMFSPGNEAERARMGALVAASREAGETLATFDGDPESDPIPDRIPDLDPAPDGDLESVGGPSEQVFDMFAGAGYFALPAAIAGAAVTATEIDPDTFQYLIENAQLNGVGDRVAAYLSDCREVADVVDADRVIMGHFDAAEYLDAAFEAVRDGGVIHYHGVVPEAELWERPRERLESAAAAAGRSIEIEDERRVKSYGEGVWHVVVDVRVSDEK
jgi:tRNA wybutosine-synthesizing protein 2